MVTCRVVGTLVAGMVVVAAADAGAQQEIRVDLGNPVSEAAHNLTGWGHAEAVSPVPAPSGDSSKRFQRARGNASLDFQIPPGKVPRELVAEIEDGGCDDSFAVYVNGTGPVYSYQARPELFKVLVHNMSLTAAPVPAGTVMRVTFQSLTSDNCGGVPTFNVVARLDDTAGQARPETPRREVAPQAQPAKPPQPQRQQPPPPPEEACAACGACFGGGLFAMIGIPLVFFVLNIALLVWVARDAKARGMDSAVLWMVLVMFTSVIGLLIYIFSRPQGNLVQCQHCNNKRLQASAKCPHCGNA